MLNLLLDTNAVIRIAEAPAGTAFPGVPEDAAVAVSVITELELRYGVAKSVGRPEAMLRVDQLTWLLARYQPIPVDAAVAGAFLSVAGAALAAGQNPRKRMNDLMIAATALAHGATLVTDDHGVQNAVSGVVPVRALS